MKQSIPYYREYPGDYLRTGAATCSLAAQGLRKRLKDIAHDATPRGYVPFTDEELVRRVPCSLAQLVRYRQELLAAGAIGRGGDGVLFFQDLINQETDRKKWREEKQRQRHPEGQPLFESLPQDPAPAAPVVPPARRTPPDPHYPQVRTLSALLDAAVPDPPKKICPPDVHPPSESLAVTTAAAERQPRYRSSGGHGGAQNLRARKRRTTDPEGLEWAAINLLLASDGWPDREIPGMLRWLRDKAGDPPMDLVLYDLLALCRRTNVIKIQRSRTAYVWGCNEKPSDVEHRAARDAYHQIIRLVAEPSFHHNAN